MKGLKELIVETLEKRPATTSDVARQTGFDPLTVKGYLDWLEDQGRVRKAACGWVLQPVVEAVDDEPIGF